MNAGMVNAEATESMINALGRVTLDGLIEAGILLLLGFVVIRIIMQMLRRVSDKLPLEKTVTGFLISAMKTVLFVILGTIVADKLGIPITSVIALISLFALAISLSLQDVLSNMVSGIVILMAKPFSNGDYIETNEASGTVDSIGLMYTHLLSPDNKAVMVPNKELCTGRITNYSAEKVRRVDASVRVGYEYDSHAVLSALLRAAQRTGEGHEGGQPPFVGINAYQNGGIEYAVRVYVPTKDYWDVYHALMLSIRDELSADGIALDYAGSRIVQNG